MPDAKMLQEISNWPQLKITYRTDPEKIAALLPPGIDPNSEPHVHLSIYNVPILGEPEYGIVTKIKADYRGTPGWYTIGYAIDQEAAVFISQELNGQPKYPAEIHYYRIGDAIEARGIHQGYTFVEFKGEVKEDLPNDEPYEMNEWWIKSVRAVNGAEKAYDFPPHVVHVKGVSGTTSKQRVEGELTLRDVAQQQLALAVDRRSPSGIGIPGIADQGAAIGGIYVVVARAANDLPTGKAAHRIGKVTLFHTVQRALNVLRHGVRRRHAGVPELPAFSIGNGALQRSGMLQRQRLQQYVLAPQGPRLDKHV